VFDEYLFSSFFMRPNSEAIMARVLKVVLHERFVEDAGPERSERNLSELTNKYLDQLFDDFFNMINASLRSYTTSLNEYIYFVTFLYPEFMAPLLAFLQSHSESELSTSEFMLNGKWQTSKLNN
jgi:hypothetical protein